MIFETVKSKRAPKAAGPYSPALQAGDFFCLSGQLPIDPETGELVSDDIREQTRQCIRNLQAVLREKGLDLCHVMQVRVYLTDLNDLDAVNETYTDMFHEPYPARLCVGVASLLKEARIEMEAFALDTRALEILCASEGCEGCDGCCGEEENA